MLLTMTGQSLACNKLHIMEQQLARWLLLMHDYAGDELLLTQELIAQTLDVRRAGITDAAVGFKNAGLIEYQRGRIQLVERSGLEAHRHAHVHSGPRPRRGLDLQRASLLVGPLRPY